MMMKKRKLHFCIHYFSKKKQKLAKRNTGQCCSIKSKTMYKTSADLDKTKKIAKIQEDMYVCVCFVVSILFFVLGSENFK